MRYRTGSWAERLDSVSEADARSDGNGRKRGEAVACKREMPLFTAPGGRSFPAHILTTVIFSGTAPKMIINVVPRPSPNTGRVVVTTGLDFHYCDNIMST